MAGSPKARYVCSSQTLSYWHPGKDKGEAVEYLCQSLLLCPMPSGSAPSGVVLRLHAREPSVCWDSSFLNPAVERYSARARVREASLTRGPTAAAPPAVMHLRQPDQASDPPVCATESPKACLARATQVLALGNSPEARRAAALAMHDACMPHPESTHALCVSGHTDDGILLCTCRGSPLTSWGMSMSAPRSRGKPVMGPRLRGGSSAWPRMPAAPPLAGRLPFGSLGSGPDPLLPRLRDR